ncbi:MAG: hypothetical protein D3903_07980 [Candidatus Electrothrix sp. GM3_4]|nr:hypothetical protein [Candidatus Electrothrix sp. GM3_4]
MTSPIFSEQAFFFCLMKLNNGRKKIFQHRFKKYTRILSPNLSVKRAYQLCSWKLTRQYQQNLPSLPTLPNGCQIFRLRSDGLLLRIGFLMCFAIFFDQK